MKTHLAKTESLTVVIDGAEITVTAQQLLGMKQAETTDPDEKYRSLLEDLKPTYWMMIDGTIADNGESDRDDFELVPTQLSAQRVRTYIKMLNIAAKLNGEADWNGTGAAYLYSDGNVIVVGEYLGIYMDCAIQFRTEALALEALTYLNSEDKIAMFGCDKVKEG